MENSLNSSSPESSASAVKSVFQKQTDLFQGFEVSLEESVTAVQGNKSDQGLDSSSSGSKKVLPFKKIRKSIQHPFSVTSDDSLVNSETEESVTFKKPQTLFSKKNKTLMGFFNVSFNETHTSKTDIFGKSFDDSNTVYNKTNPFKRKDESQKEILVGDESSLGDSSEENNKSQAGLEESQKHPVSNLNECDEEFSTFLTKQNPFGVSEKQKRDSVFHLRLSVEGDNEAVENEVEPEIQVGNESQLAVSSTVNDNSNVSLKKSQKHSLLDMDFNEADSTTYNIKQNPFKKSDKRGSLTQFQLSITNENNSPGNKTTEVQSSNLRENDDDDDDDDGDDDLSTVGSKVNPFGQKKSSQGCNSMISITEEGSRENSVTTNPEERSQNISINRSIRKSTNNTVSYLEQSSINDENLNNWMSDQSDEEIPPPRIPSLNGNLSQIKERPAISSPTNTLSVWEKKLSEIVSNAENKRQALKLKMTSNSPQQSKPLKKPEKTADNQAESRYKPPKLIKPAPFATKKLYNYVMKKLEPKYGIDTVIESENLVASICDTVKKVTRKKTYQKKLIQNLKKEMAEAGLIETTVDFYEFIIKFLPYSFRVKVVPCVQPVTNIVYPPKDVVNPFDKIL